MQTNSQTGARKLHARLSHPIIDADGHWLEYAPIMREEFRRIGGEATVEAYDLASERVPYSLKMSLPERRRRRVGQEAFWGSPCENVLEVGLFRSLARGNALRQPTDVLVLTAAE